MLGFLFDTNLLIVRPDLAVLWRGAIGGYPAQPCPIETLDEVRQGRAPRIGDEMGGLTYQTSDRPLGE